MIARYVYTAGPGICMTASLLLLGVAVAVGARVRPRTAPSITLALVGSACMFLGAALSCVHAFALMGELAGLSSP